MRRLSDAVDYLFHGLSYRVRFLLFALLLFAFTPLPMIWNFQGGRFWVRETKWRVAGNTVQKHLNDLMSLISQGRIERNFNEDIKKQIAAEFKFLSPYGDQATSGKYQFDDGFSVISSPAIQISEMKRSWDAYKDVVDYDSEANEAYQIIIDQILGELQEVGYSYGLSVNLKLPIQVYSQLVLYAIPLNENYVTQMVSRAQKLASSQDADESMTAPVFFFFYKIKQITQQIKQELEAVFKHLSDLNQLPEHRQKNIKVAFEKYETAVLEILDVIVNDLNMPQKSPAAYEAFNQAKKNLILVLYEETQTLLQSQYNQEIYIFYTWMVFVTLALLFSIIMVRYRFVSYHFEAFKNYIKELSEGKLSHCFCSHQNDEFGAVGRVFDKVVDAIRVIMSNLDLLNGQIQEMTERVTLAVKSQEESLREQEKIIQQSENTAQKHTQKSKVLSMIMIDICASTEQSSTSEVASAGLLKIQENMKQLAKLSGGFLSTFDLVTEEFNDINKKIYFMDRLGSQAKIVSLRSKTENASLGSSGWDFSEITKKIEYFSEGNEATTTAIKKILKDVSVDVHTVRDEAQNCFIKITSGVEQLTHVNNKLGEISQLGTVQQLKFRDLGEMMTVQVEFSENILNSIRRISAFAKDNIEIVEVLPDVIVSMSHEQKKLQAVINKLESHI